MINKVVYKIPKEKYLDNKSTFIHSARSVYFAPEVESEFTKISVKTAMNILSYLSPKLNVVCGGELFLSGEIAEFLLQPSAFVDGQENLNKDKFDEISFVATNQILSSVRNGFIQIFETLGWSYKLIGNSFLVTREIKKEKNIFILRFSSNKTNNIRQVSSVKQEINLLTPFKEKLKVINDNLKYAP